MRRRALLALATCMVPVAARAQQPATPPPWRGSGPPRSAEERDARHRWLEDNWDTLPPADRQRVEERFRRGMGMHGPPSDEMRRRWDGMTPGQRQELMGGWHRGGGTRGPQGPGPRRAPSAPAPGPAQSN
jgi:hypothetical protein